MKLTTDSKVVCCCRRGQVRSVAARNVLLNYGLLKVLTCGLENNDQDTLKMLYQWADAILVVGSPGVWLLLRPEYKYKAHFLEVGHDLWGDYRHEELQCLLKPLISNLF